VKKEVPAIRADSGERIRNSGDFTGAGSKADAVERVAHLMMVAGGENVFLVEQDAVVALDGATGKRPWRAPRPPGSTFVTNFNYYYCYYYYYFSKLSTPVYHDGVVLFAQPELNEKRPPRNSPVKATLMPLSAATAFVETHRTEHPAVGPQRMSTAGLLDDSWFNQTYRTIDGRAHSKLLVFDTDAAYGVKPFPGRFSVRRFCARFSAVLLAVLLP